MIRAIINFIRGVLLVVIFLLIIGFLELLTNPMQFIHHR
jgi:hypothetical protein